MLAAFDIASFALLAWARSASSWPFCRIIARSFALSRNLEIDFGVAGGAIVQNEFGVTRHVRKIRDTVGWS